MSKFFLRVAFLAGLTLTVTLGTRTSAGHNNNTTAEHPRLLPSYISGFFRKQATRRVSEVFGELPERGKLFLQCFRGRKGLKRLGGAGLGRLQNVNTCPKPDGASLERDTSVGSCGDTYYLSAGDAVRIKLPSATPSCEMLFWASEDAMLVLRCRKFQLGKPHQEYLYINDGSDLGEIFHGSKAPPKMKDLAQVYMLYGRQRRQAKKGVKVKCIVRARTKTGSGGGGYGGYGGGQAVVGGGSSSGSGSGGGGGGGGSSGGQGGGSSGGVGGGGGGHPIGNVEGQQASNCASMCGKAPVWSGTSRIVGGAEAREGEYPWLVVIILKTSQGTYLCGASLITRTHLLSAAHCVKTNDIQVTAWVGLYNIKTKDGAEQYSVTKYSRHPHYDKDQHIYDVAIMTLEKSVAWKDSIGPICLAPPGDYVGKMAVVAGWGTTSYKGKRPAVLHEVALEIITRKECEEAYKKSEYNLDILESHMCAASAGKDSCQGDSGGPMVILEKGIWYQVGIVSYGIGCANPKYPGVYSNVSYFSEWIMEHISGSC